MLSLDWYSLYHSIGILSPSLDWYSLCHSIGILSVTRLVFSPTLDNNTHITHTHRYADGDETERVYFSDRCEKFAAKGREIDVQECILVVTNKALYIIEKSPQELKGTSSQGSKRVRVWHLRRRTFGVLQSYPSYNYTNPQTRKVRNSRKSRA